MSHHLDSLAARTSVARAREVLEQQLVAPGSDAGRTGEDLFAVTTLLDESIGLRRALTDPSRSGEAKADFVRRALGQRISPSAVEVVAALASGTWTAGREIADATERLAVLSVVEQADRTGRLETLEDELFRFSRTIAGSPGLRDALADEAAPPTTRATLVASLLVGRAAPETVQLARRVAMSPRGSRAERVLAEFVEIVAARRQQLLAHVVVAHSLTAAQHDRLAAGLARQYGRAVRLNVDVDPDLVGGLRVSLGDDVIDGSISSRLAEARRRLAG